MSESQVDIDRLISDRDAFNSLIYTPLDKAVEILKERKDVSIPECLMLPSHLSNRYHAILFRQVITSNYEVRRFVSLIDSTELHPLFWEYYDDKFTSNNEWKHSLGRLFFYKGIGKKNGAQIHSRTVVDFNEANGKPLKDVKTLWGQSLVDFHHELFENSFRPLNDDDYFDASTWFAQNGKNAQNYYRCFLSLFLKSGVLFENFMLDHKELAFTRDVFLPAFLQIYQSTGLKPIIVSLEPTEIEGDRFWICHPFSDLDFIQGKLDSQS